MIDEHVLSLIGNTPLVTINRLNPYSGVRIAAKLEERNPGGSIKDRVALAMIEQAEASGELTPDKVVIEATSGNTGIGLAMLCAVKGYQLMLLMPESASEERRRVMLAYGASIRLTPGHLSTDGAIEEAYRLYREEPGRYVLMDQFNNPASIAAHYQGTAQEIWDQTQGRVTHVVAALGTSGTAMGLAKRLKELNPEIRIVAVEPFAGHKIQGLKNMQESYPPGIYDRHVPDMILHVEDESAFALCRQLACKEGIFAGMSSGAALSGALRVAAQLEECGQTGLVVTIFPDGGIRYLSTPLFAPPQEQGVSVRDLRGRGPVTLRAGKTGQRLFTPGPSLDHWADASAWRRIVLLDILARYQRQKSIPAQALVGIADLDDRAVNAARTRGVSLEQSSQELLEHITDLARQLGAAEHVRFVVASGCSAQQLQACRKLLNTGLGYEKLRSVYFDVLRDRQYGSLLGIDPEKLRPGMTVDLEGYVKDNPRDFTLLKRTSLADLKDGYFLQTEWGNVRPSWYLQMAGVVLAAAADDLALVLGDEDHRFPHLENLSSIWRGAARIQPQAWITAQTVSRGDPAESCPLTTFLEAGVLPLALRCWLLSGSYHAPLQCTEDSLAMWSKNQQRVQETLLRLHALAAPAATTQCPATRNAPGQADLPDAGQFPGSQVGQTLFNVKKAFADCLDNDLNLPAFWPTLFQFTREINASMQRNALAPEEALACVALLRHLDDVLGLLDWSVLPCRPGEIPVHVQELCDQRDAARMEKNYAKADMLRAEIEASGFRLRDTAAGPLLFAC